MVRERLVISFTHIFLLLHFSLRIEIPLNAALRLGVQSMGRDMLFHNYSEISLACGLCALPSLLA